MVVGAFPLIKLGGLLLRQISKPIANYVKEQAKSSLFFRTYICMPPAQLYNWCEIQTKMWILNLGKPVNIPVLSEAMAIELGANLLGEGIVFCVAAGLLIAEYNRGTKKEEAKEAARKEEVNILLSKLQDLYFKVERQDAQIRELTRTVVSLDNKSFSGLFRHQSTGNQKPIESSHSDKSALSPPINESEVQIEITTQEQTYELQKLSFILRAANLVQEEITGRKNHGYRNNDLNDNYVYIPQNLYQSPISVK